MKYIYISIFALFSLLVNVLQAQERVTSLITGKVTDTNNHPVSGMTIEVQEIGTGTKTDATGKFAISVAKGDVLVFTKEGYLTSFQDVIVSKNELVIHVKPSIAEAGETDNVHIPFGIVKKREINGAVSTIQSSGLSHTPSSSLFNALPGQTTGFNIWQSGTLPGRDDATFVIRNRASFAGSNVPLVLVDGVARDFSDMDLNEIESVTVLKDAASLAWYGNRGANGALLVTTKRGNAEKTTFSYDVQLGSQMPTALTKPVDSYNFGRLYNQALQNDGSQPFYTPSQLDNYKSGTDLYGYPNNNFVKDFINNNALVQRHVLTASGGSKAIRYFTTLSFFDQNGLFKGAQTPLYNSNVGYQRYNLRTNLDMQVTPMLNVQLDMGGRVEDRSQPGGGSDAFLNSVFTTPSNAYALLNEDGSYGGTSSFQNNPLAQLKSKGYSDEVTRILMGTLNATHKLDFIAKGLSANLFYTFDIQGVFTSGRSQNYEVYQRSVAGSLTQFGTATPLVYLTSAFSNNIRANELWTGFDYKNSFGKHTVSATVRYQQAVVYAATQFENKRQGVSARGSYSYDNRYYLDLVASYTGADNYMPGKQFGYFPAMALGWVISEEKFMKNIKFIDYLKLRGSYGMAGNNSTGESSKFPYAYLYTPTTGGYTFGSSYTFNPGGAEATYPNPNITWEKAYKTDIGFDLKLLKNSLSISGTYFNEDRKDILTNPLYPSIVGLNSYNINDGQTRLRGFEGTIDYTKKIGDFTLYVGANFTSAKNIILRINESAGLTDYQLQKGHNIGSINGYDSRLMLLSDGIFQSQAEIDASPVQRFSGKVVPGDIKYRDINGDKVIDNMDRVMTDYNDTPDAYYGFKFGGMYKGFDFSILMQGVNGRTIQIRSLVLAGSNNTGYINQFSEDAWTSSNPTAPYPRLGISDRGNNTANSDFWLRSGDYLRLKSIELGYTIPSVLTDKVHIRSLRFYLNGFNLYNFNKTGMDIDPELNLAGFNSVYPYSRTISVGLNLKF
ncbi:MAG: TonB-dependent receptor [Sulfuricurvum sp.]|nr:TonB-dependent receptor [Sulfuricurvum sp.]